jgi:hypothetical protein
VLLLVDVLQERLHSDRAAIANAERFAYQCDASFTASRAPPRGCAPATSAHSVSG